MAGFKKGYGYIHFFSFRKRRSFVSPLRKVGPFRFIKEGNPVTSYNKDEYYTISNTPVMKGHYDSTFMWHL